MQLNAFLTIATTLLASSISVSAASTPKSFRLKAASDAPPVVAGKYLTMSFFNIDSPGAKLGWNHPTWSTFEGYFVHNTNSAGEKTTEIYLKGAKEAQKMYLQETIPEELRPKLHAKLGDPKKDPNPADGWPISQQFATRKRRVTTYPANARYAKPRYVYELGYNFGPGEFNSTWTACGNGKGRAPEEVELYLGESPVTDTGCYASFKLEVEYI